MRKLLGYILKITLLILFVGIFLHYFTIHQDGNLFKVNHAKEIGKSSGETAKKIKDTAIKIKNSPELDSLVTNFTKEFTK